MDIGDSARLFALANLAAADAAIAMMSRQRIKSHDTAAPRLRHEKT